MTAEWANKYVTTEISSVILSGDSDVSVGYSNKGCDADDGNECLDDGGGLENEGDDDNDYSRFERYDLYD